MQFVKKRERSDKDKGEKFEREKRSEICDLRERE